MAAAKEAGMRVTMSVECQELTPLAEEQEMLREVLRLYPQIDVIELITPEGGGDDSRTLTAEEALALSERLFGKEVTDSALAALSRGGNLPYGGTPTYALDGTPAQFNVGWTGSVNIEAGKGYAPNGSEMFTPFSGNRPYARASAATYVDGRTARLEAFVLTDDSGGGYTYYQLRDLGRTLGFNVGWSAEQGIYIETDQPYSESN